MHSRTPAAADSRSARQRTGLRQCEAETEEAAEEMIAAIAQAVARRGMATPVLLFLAAHRPLALVASQFMHLLDPLAGLMGVEACGDLAHLLGDPRSLPRLQEQIAAIDTPPAFPDESSHA